MPRAELYVLKSKLSNLPLARWGTSAALLLVVLGLAFTAPHFLSAQNLRNVGTQVPVNVILAAGMTLVILTGGIDLSVGSLHALCGIAAAFVITSPMLTARLGGSVVIVAILAAVALGAVLGLLNGGAIAGIGIPPFIVTLAMMSIARGVAKHLTGGIAVGAAETGTPYADAINANWSRMEWLGLGYIKGAIPVAFVVAVLVVGVLWIVLARTRFGRYVYAIGGSEAAARLAGVPVGWIKLLVYTLMGLLSGLSGAIEAAAQQNGSPIAGNGYELTAIAAVVVGGTRLEGGRGSVLGTFVGAVFIIGLMNNALNLYGVPAFWQDIAKGAIILGVALVDRVTRTN